MGDDDTLTQVLPLFVSAFEVAVADLAESVDQIGAAGYEGQLGQDGDPGAAFDRCPALAQTGRLGVLPFDFLADLVGNVDLPPCEVQGSQQNVHQVRPAKCTQTTASRMERVGSGPSADSPDPFAVTFTLVVAPRRSGAEAVGERLPSRGR